MIKLRKKLKENALNTSQNVLFINPPTLPLKDLVEGTTSRQIRAFPFGILYLSSALKKAGHKGKIACADYLVVEPEKFRNQLDDTILGVARLACPNWKPDILAFSLGMSTSWEFFNHSIKVFKKEWPDAMLFVGGMHASNTIKHLLSDHNELVDYVFAGEAENALPQLLHALENNYDHDHIVGVHCRDSTKCDSKGKLAIIPFVDLGVEKIPFPDWEIIDMPAYTGEESEGKHLFWDEVNDASQHSRDASLFTSRGCPFRCTFCAAHTIHGRKMRLRPPADVVREMKVLNEKYGVNHFHIYDDLPLVSKKRTHELLGAMKNSEIENLRISFTQTLYVNTTTPETIDAIIDYTGIKTISFAVESATKEMQVAIRKNVNLKKAKQLILHAQSRGLIVTINIILGFPFETKELMQQTVEMIEDYLKPNWAQYHVATPIVGTTMYDQFVEAGCIEDTSYAWMQTLTNRRYFDTPWISMEEMNDFRYVANLQTNFLNNFDLSIGNHESAAQLFEAVAKLYPFQIYAWDGLRRAAKQAGDTIKVERYEEKIREMVQTNVLAGEHLIKYGYMFPEVVEICKGVVVLDSSSPLVEVDPVYGRVTKHITPSEWRNNPK